MRVSAPVGRYYKGFAAGHLGCKSVHSLREVGSISNIEFAGLPIVLARARARVRVV